MGKLGLVVALFTLVLSVFVAVSFLNRPAMPSAPSPQQLLTTAYYLKNNFSERISVTPCSSWPSQSLNPQVITSAVNYLANNYNDTIGLVHESPDETALRNTYWIYSDNFFLELALAPYVNQNATIASIYQNVLKNMSYWISTQPQSNKPISSLEQLQHLSLQQLTQFHYRSTRLCNHEIDNK